MPTDLCPPRPGGDLGRDRGGDPAKSLQAQIFIPLAASLAFGLAAATVATLFLVSAAYSMLADFGWLGALAEERDEISDSVPA